MGKTGMRKGRGGGSVEQASRTRKLQNIERGKREKNNSIGYNRILSENSIVVTLNISLFVC